MHNLAYQAENRRRGFPLVCKRRTCMLRSQQSRKFEVKKSKWHTELLPQKDLAP